MNANENSYIVHYGDFKMQDWLLNADLSAGAKLTYSVLATLAGGNDHAWPSQHYLAGKISVSIRTVQRYLRELVDSGLIEKCRSYLKGRVRCFYKFLASLSPKEQHDNLSPCSATDQPEAVTNTTICREQYDKLSPSLNKEETIKRKEEILPPIPQEGIPVSSSVDQPDGDPPGREGGEFFSGYEEKEAQVWKEAQKRLSAILSEKNFHTWIAPLVCEFEGFTVLLRCPNPFFLNWVKKNFEVELKTALASVGPEGFTGLRFELMTAEQEAEQEAEQKRKRISIKEVQKASIQKMVTGNIDFDAMPLQEQFNQLYEIYPKKEKFDTGQSIFIRLAEKNTLPSCSELVKAIKRQCSNESWRRDNGRYIPHLHNWLTNRRWKD